MIYTTNSPPLFQLCSSSKRKKDGDLLAPSFSAIPTYLFSRSLDALSWEKRNARTIEISNGVQKEIKIELTIGGFITNTNLYTDFFRGPFFSTYLYYLASVIQLVFLNVISKLRYNTAMIMFPLHLLLCKEGYTNSTKMEFLFLFV